MRQSFITVNNLSWYAPQLLTIILAFTLAYGLVWIGRRLFKSKKYRIGKLHHG